jgi:hypothetical protein
MKKYTRYSEGFKDQALAKIYSRGNEQSIQGIADDCVPRRRTGGRCPLCSYAA